ncbi:MAG TPA: pentapeptide repeat-containing protein, partial [Pseudonocardiaceae bacterium]
MSTQDQAGPEERPERSFLPAPSDQANEEQTTPAIEPYAQLVEQLSSDHIEVRLGALYELECLAHARPEHRQAFVDLLCAYLRAPDPTVEDAADTSDPASAGSDSAAGCVEERQTAHERTRKQAEERQFRQSVQRVLTDHLRAERGRNPEELINPRFWPGIDLDLSGATLHDWDFTGCEVRTADFSRTHFHGFAQFREAVLHSPATFD